MFQDANNGETTMIADSTAIPENSLQASLLEQAGDRTLCDSQLFNANSISTPFTNCLRKQILTQNLSCIEVANTSVSINFF